MPRRGAGGPTSRGSSTISTSLWVMAKPCRWYKARGAGMVVGAGIEDHAAGPVARSSGDRIGEQPAAEPGAEAGGDDPQVAQLDIRLGPQVQLDEADLFAVGIRHVDFRLDRREMSRERGLVPLQPAPPQPVVADRVVETQIIGGRHGRPAADGDAGRRRRRRLLRRCLPCEMDHNRADLAGPGTASADVFMPRAQRPQEMPSSSSMSEPWAARPSSEQRKSAADAMSSALE